MARKVVRNPKIRKAVGWSILGVLVLVLLLFIPYGYVPVLMLLAAGVVIMTVVCIICVIIAFLYWIRTGYITNPLRHGPWGDWVGPKHENRRLTW